VENIGGAKELVPSLVAYLNNEETNKGFIFEPLFFHISKLSWAYV
jgi:hypothetical protein